MFGNPFSHQGQREDWKRHKGECARKYAEYMREKHPEVFELLRPQGPSAVADAVHARRKQSRLSAAVAPSQSRLSDVGAALANLWQPASPATLEAVSPPGSVRQQQDRPPPRVVPGQTPISDMEALAIQNIVPGSADSQAVSGSASSQEARSSAGQDLRQGTADLVDRISAGVSQGIPTCPDSEDLQTLRKYLRDLDKVGELTPTAAVLASARLYPAGTQVNHGSLLNTSIALYNRSRGQDDARMRQWVEDTVGVSAASGSQVSRPKWVTTSGSPSPGVPGCSVSTYCEVCPAGEATHELVRPPQSTMPGRLEAHLAVMALRVASPAEGPAIKIWEGPASAKHLHGRPTTEDTKGQCIFTGDSKPVRSALATLQSEDPHFLSGVTAVTDCKTLQTCSFDWHHSPQADKTTCSFDCDETTVRWPRRPGAQCHACQASLCIGHSASSLLCQRHVVDLSFTEVT